MSSRLGIGSAAGALLVLVGCGGAGGEATPISSPESTVPASPVPASSFTDGTTLPTVEPERFEQYDVQPRRVEVGGTITVTAICDRRWGNTDVIIEPTNSADIAWEDWFPIAWDEFTFTEEGYFRFDYRLTLENSVGPGSMLVSPACYGMVDDVGPGEPLPSRGEAGYEPIEVEVTERATGPRWASYQPLVASIEPRQIAADGSVAVTATCPGDALPGMGRVLVWSADIALPGSHDDPVLAMLTVPPDSYTSDQAAGTHTYVFSIDAAQLSELDPNGTFLAPACTTGADGGPPPLGSQSRVLVSVVDPTSG